jgi:hypothetical protein
MFLQNIQTGAGAHQASYSMGTGGAFPGLKQPGSEVNHLPPPNVEVTNEWSHTSNSPTCFQCMGRKHHNFTSFKKMVYENVTRKCEKKKLTKAPSASTSKCCMTYLEGNSLLCFW